MTLTLERSYPTPLSNSALLPLLLLSLARQRHTPDGSSKIKKEYDYVIVGGGSAGSVVANRLSEKPCVSILLLEAGGKPPLLTEVPGFTRYFWFTDVDWQYRTAPQKHTGKSLVNRQVVWPSGKMLGGCSTLNDMQYVRGNRKNYDDWEAQGAKGWSYKDVFPYFLRLEDNKDHKFLENGYHSRGGPVTVHQPRYNSELRRALYNAAIDTGYKIVDPNAARQTGFYDIQGSLRNNQRCSTAKAYLVPAENRTNLDILPNALATKIIIRNHQARGVRFDFRGHTYEVKARKEVILSAGTVNTAQLLMLSGVGPKRELQKLNIPVLADLPVGQNFHDHGETIVPYVLSPHLPDFEEKISDPDNVHQYIHNRTGPLASTNGINFIAFIKGQSIHPHVDFPNCELHFAEISASGAKRYFGLKPQVYQKLYAPYENKPVFGCRVDQMQPKSRGSVTLRSKNPYDPPIIDPNYLADPRDVEDLVQGMKTCQRIASTKPLQKIGTRPFETLIPGCEKYAYNEDKYFRCQARHIFVTGHHPVGTAKMGDPWDPTTVVDPKLRVKNIKGLRVVDASIMPIVPSGNTNIPTIMVAEKASDIIKETIDCYKSWDEQKDSWKDKEKWENPEKEETIWVEDEEWEKPEDKETIWVEEDRWEKPKDKETIWVEEDRWENPKDKETIRAEEDGWKKPKNKETIWVEKDQWKKPNDEESIWVEEETREKHKDKMTTWVKDDEFARTKLPKHKWNVPEKVTWSDTENKPLHDYFKPLVKDSWYENKDDYEADYHDKPRKTLWSGDRKNNLKDTAWKSSDDYAVAKSIDELVKLAERDSDETKSTTPWKESDDYEVNMSVEELVKLVKDENTKWNFPRKNLDRFEETKSLDELVKLADAPPEMSTKNNQWGKSNLHSKIRWY